jgi:hypothetical protein
VLEGLHAILSIPEDPGAGPVTLFHSSLHDFLTTESRSGGYFIDPLAMNADLAKLCLGCITTLPKFPFPSFRDPIHCWNLIKKHLEGQDEAYRVATRYACCYWFYHFAETSDHLKRTVLAMDLRKLLYHHLIPWRIFLAIGVPPKPWGRFDDVQPPGPRTVFRAHLFVDPFDHTLPFVNKILALIHRIMPFIWLISTRNRVGEHRIMFCVMVVHAFLGVVTLVSAGLGMLEERLVKKLELAMMRRHEVERCVQFERVWIKVC